MEDKINKIMKELNTIKIRNENLKKELFLNENVIKQLNAELEELIEYSKAEKNAKNED